MVHMGAGIAQLVGRPIENPGGILARVRVPRAARDFSPQLPAQTLLRCSYSPRVMRNRMVQRRSACLKKSRILAAIPSSGYSKTLHTQTGTGSALAGVTPYPGMATRGTKK